MQITTTIDINAPASAAWVIFGDRFAEISEWSDAITKSSIDRDLGEGAIRTCDVKAFGPVPAGQFTEELTHFDPASRSLTYVVLSGTPGFMRYVDNAWTFEGLGDDRCRITSIATFEFVWWMVPMTPLMRMSMSRSVRKFTEQLGEHVEGTHRGPSSAAAPQTT